MVFKKVLIFISFLIWIVVPSISFATPILEKISPTYDSYLLDVDFNVFEYSATGDVTSLLESVPNYGEPADFAGFSPGNIALIERGSLFFRDKVLNAEAAGAVGVIIYNHLAGLVYGTLQDMSTSIPSVLVTQSLGSSLIGLLATRASVEMRILVDETPLPEPIPEPATMLLLGTGLVGVAGAARRKKKNQA